MRFFIYVIVFLVVASCSNTSIYNRTVTQGTVFKQDDIDRLEIGMSKDQVSFIMGQPSFQNIFDENIWDYYFQVKNGAKIQSEKKLKLLFDENGDYEYVEVPSKKNRLITFDSRIMHSGTNQTDTPYRLVLNINYT